MLAYLFNQISSYNLKLSRYFAFQVSKLIRIITKMLQFFLFNSEVYNTNKLCSKT